MQRRSGSSARLRPKSNHTLMLCMHSRDIIALGFEPGEDALAVACGGYSLGCAVLPQPLPWDGRFAVRAQWQRVDERRSLSSETRPSAWAKWSRKNQITCPGGFGGGGRIIKGGASRASTFVPPAILRVRRFKARAVLGSIQGCGQEERRLSGFRLAKSDVEKGIAEIGPLRLVLAAKRCMISIRCGDDKRISICEARNEDARIAGPK